MLRLLALTLCLVAGAFGVGINNGLVGDPEVECLSDRVKMVFTTEAAFQGVIYAKNFFLEDGCSRPNAGNGALAQVEYTFDSCGVTRQRSLEPRGVFVTGTIVIQFHPLVLTKVDRAIRFQCFYMEADKTVDAPLEVSMITTEFQTFQVPMPTCQYQILDESGNEVKFATIGQKVFHTWKCDTDTENIFCMEVYGCYVGEQPLASAEESETSIRLLNEDGCALDGNLLQNPEYDDSDTAEGRGLSAQREGHVFKYADRPALFFNCQIRIGVRDPGTSCADYREQTGGVCSAAPLTRRKRSSQRSLRDLGTLDVVPAHSLYIADLDMNASDLRSPAGATGRVVPPLAPLSDISTFCVSPVSFGVLLSLLGVFIISSIALAIVLCRKPAKL